VPVHKTLYLLFLCRFYEHQVSYQKDEEEEIKVIEFKAVISQYNILSNVTNLAYQDKVFVLVKCCFSIVDKFSQYICSTSVVVDFFLSSV